MGKTRKFLAVLLPMLIVSALISSGHIAQAATSVFINEIHYDNSGTDTGEAIEIAGPAGTDLSGWSLVHYNGSNSSIVSTVSVNGTINDQCNGFGTIVINYPSNGLQNGSPDGIALADAGGNLIQFLSWEGSFTAVGGPADGVASVDLGVSESSGTPAGQSLQLTGEGTMAEDFTWTGPNTASFGDCNADQAFAGGPSGPSVALNEIVVSTPSTDWEFVEIAGDPGTSLDGLTFLEIDRFGNVDDLIALSGNTIPASGLFVAAAPAAVAQYGIVANLSFPNNLLTNNTSTYLLVSNFTGADGDSLDPGATGSFTVTPWDAIVDQVALIEAAGETVYGSPAFGPAGGFLPAGAYLCDNGWSTHSFGSVDVDGSPGAANPLCSSGPATDVLINEIDADQTSTDSAEFIELIGTPGTALDGLTVVLYNGNGDASYNAFDLDGLSIGTSGYFVICGNAATVANCDLDVNPNTNLIQNGADAAALVAGDAVNFPFGTPLSTANVVDAIVYDTNDSDDAGLLTLLNSGQPQVNENANSSATTESNQRCPNGSGGARNTDTFAQYVPTPGEENVCEIVVPPLTCTDDSVITSISDIQGSGASSPLVGANVIIEGVVVGDFQNNGSADNGDLRGFHVQQTDDTADGDPATSDGIFVFESDIDVALGDKVRVAGTVAEFNSLTEIVGVTDIAVCADTAIATPAVITLPLSSTDDLEAYEGMAVTFPQSLTIVEFFNFDRFGEMVLATDRQFQPTALAEPGSPEAAQIAADNALSRIKLDDGRTASNPDPSLHPNGQIFDLTNTYRGGDLLTNVTGVIDYAFGEYRIQPTAGADYTATNPRSGSEPVGGSLTVASFNVLNYFTTLDSRGADDPEEFVRQRTKIFAALADLDADIVGLIEIENNEAAIIDLVNGLNAYLGSDTYDYVDTGAIGPDAIKVAYIYKPATVSLVGTTAVLDDLAFLDPNNLGEDKNRPALAQSFIDDATGGIFTVAVNHLKSKGSPCGDGDDDPEAGSCNLTRTLAAQLLVDWLATDPTGSGDSDFLIIGDLNAYDKEDPIDAVIAGADDTVGTDDDYTDLMALYQGEFAYSYVFNGQLGYLDYALANEAMLDEVTGTTAWHINSDEPDILDYDTTFKKDAQDALYEPNAFRSSDHDPIIVGLDVCDEIAPTIDITLSHDMLWPPNHQYVTVTADVVASDNFDTNPMVSLVSVTSNEADNGVGDGNTINDIVIIDDTTFDLRAERSAQGDGRVYTITYEVTDACGNSTIGTATVVVPLNKGKK